MLWVVLRLLSLILAIVPILYLYRNEEKEEIKKLNKKYLCSNFNHRYYIIYCYNVYEVVKAPHNFYLFV
jgi:hypothetical protein